MKQGEKAQKRWPNTYGNCMREKVRCVKENIADARDSYLLERLKRLEKYSNLHYLTHVLYRTFLCICICTSGYWALADSAPGNALLGRE